MSEDETRAAWLDREPYAGLMLADYATEVLTQARARGESLDGYRLVLTAERRDVPNPTAASRAAFADTSVLEHELLEERETPDA